MPFECTAESGLLCFCYGGSKELIRFAYYDRIVLLIHRKMVNLFTAIPNIAFYLWEGT